jgi:phage repressor protein C with HTH and peptisase S24 domain
MRDISKIIERMILACKAKNQTQMLEMIGLSNSAASMWKKHEYVADGALAKVSELAGVSISWIRTGDGEMRSGEATSKTSLSDDLQTMRLTIQAVEEHLQAEGKQLPPAKKSELITTLYEMFIEEEDRKVDKKTVAKLIQLAS